MEAPLSDLMSTRGVEVDKSKRWQQFGWGNNSKTGPVVAKGILGWDVELAVKRRPIVEGLLGSIDVCGPSHLSPISFRLETNLQRRPIEEGYLGSMEGGGLSQVGPLPNMHLKSCVEVG